MGNTIMVTHCFRPDYSPIKLIPYGGATRTLTGKHLAGQIMFEFPDLMVCHADSFFIGHPIPSLAIDDELVNGQTYLLLPLDVFANKVLSASSLATMGSDPNKKGAGSSGFKGGCPFEYMKGSDGRVLIKVIPEFIIGLISRDDDHAHEDQESCNGIVSTPELQKHYNQLVGCKDHQTWSPKLETISEYKIRFSPCRFVGLEWKHTEEQG